MGCFFFNFRDLPIFKDAQLLILISLILYCVFHRSLSGSRNTCPQLLQFPEFVWVHFTRTCLIFMLYQCLSK